MVVMKGEREEGKGGDCVGFFPFFSLFLCGDVGNEDDLDHQEEETGHTPIHLLVVPLLG